MKTYVDNILKNSENLVIFGHNDLDGINAVYQFIIYVESYYPFLDILNYEFCNYALSKIKQLDTVIENDFVTYVFLDLNIDYCELKNINKFIFLDHHSNQRILKVANNKQLYYKSEYTKCASMIVNDLHRNKIYNYESKLINAFDTGHVNLFNNKYSSYSRYDYMQLFYNEILDIYCDLIDHFKLFKINKDDYNFNNIVMKFKDNIDKNNIIMLFNLENYEYITEYIVSLICKYVYDVCGYDPYLMLFIINHSERDHYKISIRSDSKRIIDINYLKNVVGINKSYGHDTARACFLEKIKLNDFTENIKNINKKFQDKHGGLSEIL